MSLNKCGKPKIWNLEIVILIEKYVFWLKISVSNALIIQEFYSIDQLSDQSSANLWWESSLLWNEVEQFSLSEFKNNNGPFFQISIFELDIGVGISLNNIDQIFELEFLEELNFSFEAFFFGDSITVDLDRIKLFPFASKIDTLIKQKNYLAWPPYPRRKWRL